jgi:DNA-directed RNA polymerase subunit RPC12/RpoP
MASPTTLKLREAKGRGRVRLSSGELEENRRYRCPRCGGIFKWKKRRSHACLRPPTQGTDGGVGNPPVSENELIPVD